MTSKRKVDLLAWANHEVVWGSVSAFIGLKIPAEDLACLVGRGAMVVAYDSPTDETPEGVVRISTHAELRQIVFQCSNPIKEILVAGGDGNNDEELQVIAQAELFGRSLNATTKLHNAPDIAHGLSLLPTMLHARPVSALYDSAPGGTAVVVGAGPSLERNIKDLVGREDLIVIATNTAVPALEAAGVQPDLIVCADHQEAAYLRAAETESWHSTPRVVECHAHESAWEGDQIYWCMAGGGTWSKFVKHVTGEGILPSGGSVSTIAYTLAKRMGCSRIVLIGMDCAVDSSGQTYAPSTNRSAVFTRSEHGFTHENGDTYRLIETDAWGGIGKAHAFDQLAVYRLWYEMRADEDADDIELINSTEGGARIEGWKEVRLEDLPTGEKVRIVLDDLCYTPRAEAWITAIEEQIRGLKPVARAAARRVDACRQWLDAAEATRQSNAKWEARLINGYSVSADWNEVGIEPPKRNIELIREAFARQITKSHELKELLTKCKQALEESK